MPEVDKIVSELHRALEGLGRARTAAAQADAKAAEVQGRAAQTGLRGVAENVARVREQLGRAQTLNATVGETLEAAVGIVQKVVGDMTPDEVVATLSPAAEKISGARTQIAAAVKELDGAKGQAAAALQGGQRGPLVTVVDQARQLLAQAMAVTEAAKQRADEAIGETRQIGNF